MEHFGTQRSKRWFTRGPVLEPAPAPRHGVQLPSLRRGVLLPQSRTRVSTDLRPTPGTTDVGADAYALMERLFPLCRSLTGAGVRATFDLIAEEIPITRPRSPAARGCSTGSCRRSGTSATPTSPRPTAPASSTSADSSLHVVSYSEPVRTTLPLDALRERLHTLPDHPDLIPYRTSYYDRTWGFCLSHRQLLELEPGDYEVVIDSTLEPATSPTRSSDSRARRRGGPCLDLRLPPLARQRQPVRDRRRRRCSPRSSLERRLRHTYRFLFAPGTIGPLAWLHQQPRQSDGSSTASTLSCIGDAGTSPTSAAAAATPT